MPKKMFFNISEEKRTMFLNVAISEFTHKSFEQVSVNTIIKKANISRGSFYTYFEDLESLFNYILKDLIDERFKYAMQIIKDCDHDYFAFIKTLFEYDFDNYSKTGKYSLFRNYIHYIQSYKKGSIKDAVLSNFFAKPLQDKSVKEIFNIDALNITTEAFIDLIEIVLIIMMNTYIKAENEQLSKKDAIALFNQRISFIEFGVKKGGKN